MTLSIVTPEVRNEVETLKSALKQARDKILQQGKKLEELTTPPFVYATVVALSGWRDNRESKKKKYKDTLGEEVEVDTKTKVLAEYHLGDVLKLIDNDDDSRVIEVLKEAKRITVVGFPGPDRLAVQIDDGLVVVDYLWVIRKTFEVVEVGRVGMINTAVIIYDNVYNEVILPEGCKANPGDTVTLVKETSQIIDVASVQVVGDIGYVTQVIEDPFVEVDYQSTAKVVFCGNYSGQLGKGDRVVLDPSATVIVYNLGKEDDRFRFTADSGVTWNDIAGLESAKAQMIEAVELPYLNPEIVKFYNKKPVKGILLYGPPGCGKTMLGKATATAISKINSRDTKRNGFIYIKGPEILERYIGVAEGVIRQVFARARAHKQQFGFPAVIFIDEAEALMSKRGSGISSDIEKTIVPMFCTEMDGLEESGALVILASNRPDIIDPAIVRDGRIDRKIKIDRPTVESAKSIFLLNLKGVPVSNGYSFEELAGVGSLELFSSRRQLYEIQTRNRGTIKLSLGDIINGGMVAGVVEKAISRAISRDISQKTRNGLSKEDIVCAVDLVEIQNRDLNHADELIEFTRDFRDEVVGVQKLVQSMG